MSASQIIAATLELRAALEQEGLALTGIEITGDHPGLTLRHLTEDEVSQLWPAGQYPSAIHGIPLTLKNRT